MTGAADASLFFQTKLLELRGDHALTVRVAVFVQPVVILVVVLGRIKLRRLGNLGDNGLREGLRRLRL